MLHHKTMEFSEIGALLAQRLQVSQGDITQFAGDAIVNAANSSLMGGGGVDGAIHRVGGSRILAECRKVREKQYPQGLPTGEAITTGGGNLQARYVIHTVSPIWHGGQQRERQLLASCYQNTLQEALRLKIKSLAYPAIGTGVYHFPKEEAAAIAIETIAKHCAQFPLPTYIHYMLFSAADSALFQAVLQRYH